jgi:hypothetical protein
MTGSRMHSSSNSTLRRGKGMMWLTSNRVAESVLAAINTALSKYPTTKVTLVGHSLGTSHLHSKSANLTSDYLIHLGAAISLLDSVYLPLHLPSTITYKTITYGMPRVSCLPSTHVSPPQSEAVTADLPRSATKNSPIT